MPEDQSDRWRNIETIPKSVLSCLEKVEEEDFNIFDLRARSNGNELMSMINYLLMKYNLFDKMRIDQGKFIQYSVLIQQMYQPIAYHNKTHAADVT